MGLKQSTKAPKHIFFKERSESIHAFSAVLSRRQGSAADPVYVKGEVFAYVRLPQNLQDLKDVKGVSLGYVGRIKT